MSKRNGILVIFSLLFVATVVSAPQAKADSLTVLGTDSQSLLEGAPGQIVGYGFIFETPADYAILNFSEFDPAPDFADYTDYISSNFITTQPGVSVTETFSQAVDPTTGEFIETGLGQFLIQSDATVGESLKGVLTLDYDLYSVDPNSPDFDPTADLVSAGNELNAFVGVKVVAPVVAAAEPASFGLLGFGFLVMSVGLLCGKVVGWTANRSAVK